MSVIFSPSSFFDFLNHHTSDLRVGGASVIWQTLPFGSPSPLSPSSTFTLLLDLCKWGGSKRMTGTRGTCCSHLPPFCFTAAEKNTLLPRRSIVWRSRRHFCHRSTVKLMIPLCPLCRYAARSWKPKRVSSTRLQRLLFLADGVYVQDNQNEKRTHTGVRTWELTRAEMSAHTQTGKHTHLAVDLVAA